MPRVRILVLATLCLGLLVGAAQRAGAAPRQAGQPMLLMSAVQLADSARYSVTLLNPTQATLDNLQMQVQLPADAVFDHALETPGYTQFAGSDNSTLSWTTGAAFAPTDEIDAFTFFLQQPSSGSFTVTASWDGGSAQGQFAPVPQAATESEATVTLDAASLASGNVPVGNTGVVILAFSGDVPAGTVLHVQLLGPDADPPAGTGDLWWCAVVRIDGLPPGTGVVVQVPARQPLPPGAPLTVLQDSGGASGPVAGIMRYAQTGAALPSAQVTANGQFIQLLHSGGLLRAGTGRPNQPLPAGTVVSSGGLGGRTAVVTGVQQQVELNGFAAQMQQPCNSSRSTCPSATPVCPHPFSDPNLPQQAGRRTCNNVTFNGFEGMTTCDFVPNGSSSTLVDGGNCVGTVPEYTGGRVPPMGAHGTLCHFNSIFDQHPFAQNCTEF